MYLSEYLQVNQIMSIFFYCPSLIITVKMVLHLHDITMAEVPKKLLVKSCIIATILPLGPHPLLHNVLQVQTQQTPSVVMVKCEA